MIDVKARRNGLPAGTHLGEFVLEDVLQSGGDALVYRAVDSRRGSRVVLKEFFPLGLGYRTQSGTIRSTRRQNDLAFELGREAFVQEADLLQRGVHPNFVKYKDRITSLDTAFIILEYVHGLTLEQFFEQGNWDKSSERWWAIALDVLGALSGLHEIGYIHADLSTKNIIVRPCGAPVVVDLGSAQSITGRQFVRSVSENHCAIELVTHHRRATPASDLFSLASILYHALTGKPCPSATARLEGKQVDPLKPRARSDFERQFFGAIDKALELVPQDRMQSVDAFLGLVSWSAHDGRLNSNRSWISQLCSGLGGNIARQNTAGRIGL